MPPTTPATTFPTFTVAGQHQPALDAGLQRLSVTERSPGHVLCDIEVVDWGATSDGSIGFLWSDGRVLNIGAMVSVGQGTDVLFDGRVLALEARLSPAGAPTLVLQCTGKRPAATRAGASQLRWGADLLRLEVTVEKLGRGRPRPGRPHRTVLRARGEATWAAAVGPNALRAAGGVDLLGVGAVFAGACAVTEVTIRFDRDQGWRVEFSATRRSDEGRGG
mgnify:CR=1 FL=1